MSESKNKAVKISWGEISYIDYPSDGKNAKLIGGGQITVNSLFYNKLRSPPVLFETSNKYYNAYLFGKLYPFSSYKHIGGHGNDVANTAIVDTTDITASELAMIKDYKAILGCYQRGKNTLNWSDRGCLEKVRQTISKRVAFMGDTYGGDVGAEYFVHFKNGTIDSLIIDAFCLFTDYVTKYAPHELKMSEAKLSAAASKNFKKKFTVKHVDNLLNNGALK